eukprot:COSAG06_NODE_8329_length_2201_cov_11.429115_2_plen_91_part_00
MRVLGGYGGRRQARVYLDLCGTKIASECGEREDNAETQHLTRTRRLETLCARRAFNLISKSRLRPPRAAEPARRRRRRGLRLHVLILRGP